MANLLFYLMAVGAVVASLGVVVSRSPIASILSLLASFFCLATIYLLAGMEFVAAAQILVYGGAVMVLFLFVVMLLNLGAPESAPDAAPRRRWALPAALATSAALGLSVFVGVLGQSPGELGPGEVQAAGAGLQEADTLTGLAELLFGRYLLPFEAGSVLLLAAAVAVIVLAKRQRAATAGRLHQGESGREAA